MLQQGHVIKIFLIILVFILGSSYSIHAETRPGKKDSPAKTTGMNNKRLGELIQKVDKNVRGRAGHWQLTVDNHEILVITDEKADRMRILSPVIQSSELSPKILYRLMQANFDSALDARYSIARDTLWSTFIHPLSSLSDHEFLSGLGQVANLVSSYGGSYSSGALIFQGGDSKDLKPRKLIDELLEKGLEV